MGEHPWDRILEKTAQSLDLPGDVVAGLPRMELVGSGEFWMEGHRGILSYGDREILISGGRLVVRLRGEELELRSMNANTMCISGRIAGLELE